MRHISRFLEGVCVWDVGWMNWENVAGGKDEPLHTAWSLFAAYPRCPKMRQALGSSGTSLIPRSTRGMHVYCLQKA